MKIIIDTNFLLIPFKFNVDIFSEIERIIDASYTLFIFSKTIDELNEIINNQKGKDKKGAEFAIELIKKKSIENLESDEYVDNAILSLAKAEEIVVATQDKGLQKKISKLGRKIIILRQKNHLELR